MGRPGISYKEVKDIADSLRADGKNPTQVSVRELLGAGSYGTINKMLLQWREENGLQPASQVPMSGADVAARIAKEIEDAHAAGHAAVNARAEAAEAEADELRAALDDLQEKREADHAIIQQMKTDLAMTVGRLEQAQTQLAKLQDEMQADRAKARLAAEAETAKALAAAEDLGAARERLKSDAELQMLRIAIERLTEKLG